MCPVVVVFFKKGHFLVHLVDVLIHSQRVVHTDPNAGSFVMYCINILKILLYGYTIQAYLFLFTKKNNIGFPPF